MSARLAVAVTTTVLLIAGLPGLGIAAAGFPSAGVAADTLRLHRLVPFTRITALAADPRGGLLVADASEGRVWRVDTSGVRTGIAASGDRLVPAGLDPTNGLVLLVADPTAGTILRFAADGRFLEARPVAGPGSAPATAFDRRDVSIRGGDGSRPVAALETADGRLFVADAASGTVLLYDRGHRLLRQVPDPDGSGPPVRPIGLARVGDAVWVLDAERPEIRVLDPFGNEVRSIRFSAGVEPVAVASGGDGAWVLAQGRLLRYAADGTLEADHALAGPAQFVALAVIDGRVYVASRDGVYVGAAGAPGP